MIVEKDLKKRLKQSLKGRLKNYLRQGILLSFMLCLLTSPVMAEQVVLTAGSSQQQGGYIVLTETEAGMFQKGELTFSIASETDGIYLEDVEVEVTGGIKGVKSKVTEGKHGKVTLSISRASKEKSSIALSKFVFTVDRTVPEGSYDLEISGSAISSDEGKIVIEDFIRVATPNTEDLAQGDLPRGNATFIVGEASYLWGGTKIEMDATPYIEGEGYIMMPLIYVAKAFGISESNILFSKGTLTLFTPERTISLTTGECLATVNGNKLEMATPLVIKAGRAYVPAGQLANLLGIKVMWDNESKTACFISE